MYSHDWRAVSCIMFKNAMPHVCWPYPWVVRYRLVHFSAPVSHICLHLYLELFTSIQTLAIQRTERHWASRLDWPQIRGNTTPPSPNVSEAAGDYRQISTIQPRHSSAPQTLPQMVHKCWASVSAFIQLQPAESFEMNGNIFEHSILSLVCLLTFYTCLRTVQICVVQQYFFIVWSVVHSNLLNLKTKLCKEVRF